MGAITSITTNNFRRPNGRVVTLVYVMRARIQRNTLQSREPSYPPGVAGRMNELDAIRPNRPILGDDRGHLLASTLGGPRDILNIVPQHSELNRVPARGGHSFWILLESNFHNHLTLYPAGYIDWTIVVNYGNLRNNNLRPTGFGVSFTMYHSNGTIRFSDEIYFPNRQEDCLLTPMTGTRSPVSSRKRPHSEERYRKDELRRG